MNFVKLVDRVLLDSRYIGKRDLLSLAIFWVCLQCIAAESSLSADNDPSREPQYPAFVCFGSPGEMTDNVDVPVYQYGRSRHVMKNTPRITDVMSAIDSLFENRRIKIVEINITGSASPEGKLSFNRYLAKKRANNLYRLVCDNTIVPDSIVRVNVVDEEWGGVYKALRDMGSTALIDSALFIISAEADLDVREKKIRSLDRGRLWRKMDKEIFPALRTSGLTVFAKDLTVKSLPEYSRHLPLAGQFGGETIALPDTLLRESYLSLAGTQAVGGRQILIKTNALAIAALLVANIGVEVELARKWSINIPVYYSPYDLFKETRKCRVLAFQPELRYWLDRFGQRHFFGLHCHVAAAFNVALNDKRFQDDKSPLYGAGIDYGYSLPLGRAKRFGVDFSVGVGFADYSYETYENVGIAEGRLIGNGKKRYWGLTNAGVSFYYKFAVNTKKRSSR